MMCEHEWITMKSVNFAFSQQISTEFCHKCRKTPREIELENQLAAANARVAEMEFQLGGSQRSHEITQECLNGVRAEYWGERQRAEAAEEQKKYAYKQCDELLALNDGILKKAEEIEAQAAAMREASMRVWHEKDCPAFSGYIEMKCHCGYKKLRSVGAGAELLARMERMEAVIDAARAVDDAFMDGEPCGEILNLSYALAVLDGRDGKPGKVEET